MHTRYRLSHLSIVEAPSRAVAYNMAKMQSSETYVALLPVYTFFGMEVWNAIWKKILVCNEIWNGRFLVWNGNGMDENCQHGIWKNRLPFHTMPCSQSCEENSVMIFIKKKQNKLEFHPK